MNVLARTILQRSEQVWLYPAGRHLHTAVRLGVRCAAFVVQEVRVVNQGGLFWPLHLTINGKKHQTQLPTCRP